MMFKVVLFSSVEMDKLVIVSVMSVVEFGACSVAFVVSIGFSLARTSFFLRLGAVLHSMIGLSGKICFRCGSCFIGFQCLFMIRFILWMSSQNCVLKICFLVVGFIFFCTLWAFGELNVFYLVEYFFLFISSVFEFVDEVYFH